MGFYNGFVDIKFLNTRPSILIDLDETLNNLKEPWVRLYNEKFNDNVNHINVTEWEVYNFFPKCSKQETWDLLDTPGLFSKMVKPLENSVDVTKILSDFYELYIVTSCSSPNIIIEKYEFIENHFPHIHKSHIITCKNKALIRGDYMIDDYIENLKVFNGKGKLLLNASHNLNVEIGDDIQRVDSWDDILMYFTTQNSDLFNYIRDLMFDNTNQYFEQFKIENLIGMKQILGMNNN